MTDAPPTPAIDIGDIGELATPVAEITPEPQEGDTMPSGNQINKGLIILFAVLLVLLGADIAAIFIRKRYAPAALSAGADSVHRSIKEEDYEEFFEEEEEHTYDYDIGEEDEPEGIGRVSDLEIPMTLRECCEDVKDAFHLGAVKVFGNLEDKVKRIAICPGSGKSVIQAALDKHADVLITGDIGHHEGIDAVAQGMAIIDGGHYGIEHIFIEDMRQYLEKNLKDVEVISAPIIHPFLLV